MTMPKPIAAALSQRLDGIQMGRGIAALLVVFAHGEHGLDLPQYSGHAVAGGFFRFGHAGVDFFFVLSGFIIYYVHHGDIGRPERLGRYAWRRFTRIFPIYWVVTALVAGLSLFSSDRAARLEPWHLLQSVLLIPHGQDPLLGVAWTLEHEVLFYLLFGLAVCSRAAGVMAFTVWAALISVAQTGAGGSWLFGLLPGWFDAVECAYDAEFFMGIAAAGLVLGGRVPAPRVLAAVGCLAFLGAGLAENADWFDLHGAVGRLLFGPCAMAIVCGLAAAERAGQLRARRWGVGPALVFLGSASYALYLIHTVVIGLFARMLEVADVFRLLPGLGVLAVLVAGAVMAGAVLHVAVEKPLLAALQRKR